jgi:DNA-binding SARP family transcriptional activator/tetratricopeptide (TPR) repeat protein
MSLVSTGDRPRFRLLGQLAVGPADVPVDVGHDRQRCVLAVLLIDANRPVPPDLLIDRAWGDRLPRRPVDALYGYVSRLRRIVQSAGGVLGRSRDGYVVEVDPLAVDLHLFDDLVRRGGVESDDRRRLGYLERALALWTGDAFCAIDSPWLDTTRELLDRRRRLAERDRDDLLLGLGGHAALVNGLVERAHLDPIDERLAGQAMVALYRSGRSAEAAVQFERLRDRLAEDLGVEPSSELQVLHRSLVHAPATRVPCTLPAPPRFFAGRASQLAQISEALSEGIVAVSGAGGIGKTWLALHWAHQHRAEFPDGQLYLDLRGFDPAGDPVDPAVAIRALLAALGVPACALPADPDAQAALYRSTLAGRRVLLVLDNASDSAQVVPLLSGSPTGCLLVTSRQRLAGLVAAHGAQPLAVDVMPPAEATALLQARLGDVEPQALAVLVDRCGGLPLALGIAAARALSASAGRDGLAAVVAELKRSRLDALDTGDPGGSLRAVLAGSVRRLSAPAMRLLGRIALAPGPDIGLPAVASLAATPPDAVRSLLRELIDANLVTEDPGERPPSRPAPAARAHPVRYRMHDLVRLYAAERVGSDPAATLRLLDHYLHTAYAADRRLQPFRVALSLRVRPELHHDEQAALAWLTAERQVLATVVRYAADAGYDRHAWQLAWALPFMLDQRGGWHDQVDVHLAALESAQRLADDRALAHAHAGVARGYTWMGRFDEARQHLYCALGAFERLGDKVGQGFAHRGLARVSAMQGVPRRALDEDRKALALFDAEDHEYGRGQVLNALGWHHAHLDECAEAVRCCAQAIAIQRRIGDARGEGLTWDTLGYAWHRRRAHRQAVHGFRRAARLLCAQSDHYLEAVVVDHLGDAYAALGQHGAAHTAWTSAAQLLTTLGHPHAAAIRTKLVVSPSAR